MALTDRQKQKIEEEEKYRAEMLSKYSLPLDKREGKNKIVAALLAIFLGGLGFHKFYLGKPGQGIIYLLLCWTFVPAFLGFVEGIIYLLMSEQVFEEKYT